MIEDDPFFLALATMQISTGDSSFNFRSSITKLGPGVA